jgi:hypothetical protein
MMDSLSVFSYAAFISIVVGRSRPLAAVWHIDCCHALVPSSRPGVGKTQRWALHEVTT